MFPRYRSYRNKESRLCFYLSMPGREKGAWPLESTYSSAKYFMSTQVQGKQREIQHKKSCLHSGATLLQVEIRVALSFESLRDGEVEELRAPTPILGYARQIYLV